MLLGTTTQQMNRMNPYLNSFLGLISSIKPIVRYLLSDLYIINRIFNCLWCLQQFMHRYLIGTLFEEEEHNKKMNINSVKAKDPFGNTRWKGAFTGGFQAGFKNTCGSKDGWTPSTFVSSVFNRAEKKDQNILDYMDKEDLGREAIGQNISLRQGFGKAVNNPFNIAQNESIGDKIVSKMRKKQAFLSAPQDIKQLHKLLQNYERQEQVYDCSYNAHVLKGKDNYLSVGSQERPPGISFNNQDDDFIAAYEDFFKKVIRASVREQSEEDRVKRIEENKIYFDFSKPLEQQPEYLKQIQEVDDHSKPKKRRKNVIQDQRIKTLFKMGKIQHQMETEKKINYEVPENYDMYHRLKDLQEKDKKLVVASEEKPKHKIHAINKRSDLLGEGNLGSRFVSASSVICSNKFVRSGQQSKTETLQKVFADDKKNQRYWDYVLQMQGKKISAQLECLDYEEAEREKKQFEQTYRLKGLSKGHQNEGKFLPRKVQEALRGETRQVKVVRTTGVWKPQKLLCKRFGCVLPYRQQNKNSQGKDRYF